MGKTKQEPSYVCVVYGGCMKLGFARYFAVDTNSDLEEEFKKFREHYGADIKGRYVKVSDCEKELDKVRKELKKLKVHNYGDIYEININKAIKLAKDVCGVKISSTWCVSNDGNKKSSKNNKAKKNSEPSKIKVKGKKKKLTESDKENDESEDDDNNDIIDVEDNFNEPTDVELSEEEDDDNESSEEEEPPKNKKSSKKKK